MDKVKWVHCSRYLTRFGWDEYEGAIVHIAMGNQTFCSKYIPFSTEKQHQKGWFKLGIMNSRRVDCKICKKSEVKHD